MTTTPEREALAPKLENIISGHRINDDDAAWLRALLAASPAAGVPQPLTDEQKDAMHAVVTKEGRYRNGLLPAMWNAALAATPPAAPAQAMPQAFVTYGKGDDIRYSVRTSDGKAVCTCAYNPRCDGRDDRAETAQLIADALNAYAAALVSQEGAAK